MPDENGVTAGGTVVSKNWGPGQLAPLEVRKANREKAREDAAKGDDLNFADELKSTAARDAQIEAGFARAPAPAAPAAPEAPQAPATMADAANAAKAAPQPAGWAPPAAGDAGVTAAAPTPAGKANK